MKHYKYGGSTIERTLACPAWAYLAAKLPPRPAGAPAMKGTALHHLFERCILDVNYEPLPGVYEDYELTEQDFAEKLYPALDALEELKERYKITQLLTEQEVKISNDVGGTADVIGIGEVDGHKVLVIADLKTGDGVMVDAYQNKQLMFYAACAMAENHPFCADVKLVCLAIIQPSFRREHTLETVVDWAENIRDFQIEVSEAVNDAEYFASRDVKPDADCLGDHCTWCPAAVTCPAQLERAKANSDVRDFTAAELSEAMKHVAGMKAWIKGVEENAGRIARDGGKIAGHKLVKGRSTRSWTNAAAAAIEIMDLDKPALTEAIFVNELRSVAQVEKALKAHGIDIACISDYVSKSPASINLVPDSHAKDAYVLSEHSLTAKLRQAIKKQQN